MDIHQTTFRAKRTDNNQWIDGYYIQENALGSVTHGISRYERLHGVDVLYEIDPETLKISSGLYDTSERLVYSDDIVEKDGRRFIVKYEDGIFKAYYDKLDWELLYLVLKNAKVIGNTVDDLYMLLDFDEYDIELGDDVSVKQWFEKIHDDIKLN